LQSEGGGHIIADIVNGDHLTDLWGHPDHTGPFDFLGIGAMDKILCPQKACHDLIRDIVFNPRHPVWDSPLQYGKHTIPWRHFFPFHLRRLSENEKFFARSRRAKILTAGIH